MTYRDAAIVRVGSREEGSRDPMAGTSPAMAVWPQLSPTGG